MKQWINDYETRDWQTTTEGTVRYALIGLGWWTTDVAIPAIERSDLGEVSVLVSSSTEKAKRIADQQGVEHGISYDEYHDGAASDAYDAVYVGTPNAYHREYVETAADLGKGVLCEKPMESTVERAEAMVEHCEDADVPLMIAYRMQTDPAVRRARELIDDGVLGDPVTAHGANSQRLLEMIPDTDQWRLDPEISGYGTSVMDLGIYSINTARFLLDRDPVLAQAQMSSTHEAFGDVPDERSSSVLLFEDDVHLVTTSSQNAQSDTQLKITGTEGQIALDPAFHGKATLRITRGDLTVEVDHGEFDAEREVVELFDYFADRLLGDADVYPDGRHGLVDMRVIRAVHESAERDEPVDLR
jgi:xylose dehydrogenase (NAD/NADP)